MKSKPTLPRRFHAWNLILFSILFFSSLSVSASHIAGADISYEALGNDQYKISLNLYRFCTSGIPGLGNNESVCITDNCTGFSTANLTLVNGYPVDISAPCASATSTCAGGSIPGMERYLYEGVATIAPTSASCGQFRITYYSCCRNTNVNIQNAVFEEIEVSAEMDYFAEPLNNSPVFLGPPIINFCQNQVNNFNYHVSDPDGDSLYFELVSASGGNCYSSSPLVYNTPFTGAVPVDNFTIDPNTGQMSFGPVATAGRYVAVVKVSDYDNNGNLLSVVHRDILFNVQACFNYQPTHIASSSQVTGNATLANAFTINACYGLPFCFTTQFQDSLSTDTLTLTSNISMLLPGATVTYSGTNPLTMQVCWTPVQSSQALTTFTVTLKDQNCPALGQSAYTFTINLGGVYAGLDQNICPGTSTSLQAEGPGPYTWTSIAGDPIQVGTNISCVNCANPTVSPSQTTTYVVTGSNAGICDSTDTVTVNLSQVLTCTVNWSDSIGCPSDSGQVTVTASNGSGTYSYLWSTGNTNLIITDPTSPSTGLFSNLSGPAYLYIEVIDSAGCDKLDSILIDPNFVPPGSDTISICSGDTGAYVFQNQSLNYSWSPATGVSNANSGNVQLYPGSTTTYQVTGTSPGNGCSGVADITVLVGDTTCVGGDLTSDTGSVLDSSWVYLFGVDTAGMPISIDSVMTDSAGWYQIYTTESEFVVAAVPDGSLHPGQWTTYYPNSPSAQNASITSGNCWNMDLSFSSLAGMASSSIAVGSLGGFVIQGGGGGNKTNDAGDPVAGLPVILLNENLDLLQTQKTDQTGAFNFEVDELENYVIHVDRWGVDNGPAPVVALTAAQPNRNDLIFQLFPEQLVLLGPVGIDGHAVANQETFLLYPNPNQGSFNLQYQGDGYLGPILLHVNDQMGRTVWSQQLPGLESGASLQVDVTELPAGLYFFNLQTDGGTNTYRMVINP